MTTLPRICCLLAFALSVMISPASQAAGHAELTWYGQSAFVLKTPQDHVLLFDPWFGNPMNPQGTAVGETLDKVDLILVSHGHFDHVGEAAAIARRTGAKLVATLDLGESLARYGGFPADHMSYETLGNYGGTLSFFDGEVQITLVPAVHSSHVDGKALGAGDSDEKHWGGSPSGFLVKVRGGPTIYHTGDTDLFGDMRSVSADGRVDVMLACIGDHFTMGPQRAAQAVALVRPRAVVPMHYGTFVPLMTGTPDAFRSALKRLHLEAALQPMTVGSPVRY